MRDLYSEDRLDSIARETGFKSRSSKLTPALFFESVVFKELDNGTMSLSDHCIRLKFEHGIDFRKQSLNERFNASSVAFIKRLLTDQIRTQIESKIDKKKLNQRLRGFSAIKIKDSTRFQIPSNLKTHYPGYTGAATGAGIHIQYEYDIINGRVSDLRVTDAVQTDYTDAKHTLGSIESKNLIIRDLGYFCTDAFDHIEKSGAYFVSRAQPGIKIFKQGNEINFDSVYKKMKSNHLSYLELSVMITSKKMPMRLVVEILPDQKVRQRLAKATREAIKKGRSLSKEYKSRARLNLFLTNVPPEIIPAKEIREVYQLRWQIETRFKAWRSFCHLQACKKMNRYRFECYLYATLLLIMINMEIAVNYFSILWNQIGKPLSLLKFYKTTSQYLPQMQQAIAAPDQKLIDFLKTLFEISKRILLTESRRGTKAFGEILAVKHQSNEAYA